MVLGPMTVYQRGWVINSQPGVRVPLEGCSISKGMGDQFSAADPGRRRVGQYIKGDG